MILSLLTLAFGSLLLLVVPFVLLGVYIIACVLLRRQVSNLLLSCTAWLTISVAVSHFAMTVILPIVGLVPLLYIGTVAAILGCTFINWPIQEIKDSAKYVMEWIWKMKQEVFQG